MLSIFKRKKHYKHPFLYSKSAEKPLPDIINEEVADALFAKNMPPKQKLTKTKRTTIDGILN